VYSGTSRPSDCRERSDHIELLAVQILPAATANSIRNEDILHTGDQVSPTSQTVAGPPRHQTRLECAVCFDRGTGARHRLLVRQRQVPSVMAFLQCQLSVLPPALRVWTLAPSLMLRGARSICGTESGGAAAESSVAQTRSLQRVTVANASRRSWNTSASLSCAACSPH
jgi:hypothetical protein